ncbi:MAG: hypothetical protein MK212_15805 [Saprospiraceae bacterium]|nr:hypothetical protein [Saprospiraceae bacterium]
MSWVDRFDNKKDPRFRDYTSSAIIGGKRQGKSTLSKLLVEDYQKQYPWRKILIYDPSNAFAAKGAFPGYEIITLEELYFGKTMQGEDYQWQRGIMRIQEDKTNKKFAEEFIDYVIEEFRNGLIIIDEATALMKDKPTNQHTKLLSEHTNWKVDVMMIFHGLRYVPKRLRGMFWHYYLFKTDEEFEGSKELGGMNFPRPTDFYTAWLKAQRAPQYEDRIMQYFTCFNK